MGNQRPAFSDDVTFVIWDMDLSQSSAGGDLSQLSLAVRGSSYVIVTVDITDRQGFNSIPCWIRRALSFSGAASFIIVGTHSDLLGQGCQHLIGGIPARRAFSTLEMQLLCREYGCTYLQPRSAQEGADDVLGQLSKELFPVRREEGDFSIDDLKESRGRRAKTWWGKVTSFFGKGR